VRGGEELTGVFGFRPTGRPCLSPNTPQEIRPTAAETRVRS
jgi:hypothetical protein